MKNLFITLALAGIVHCYGQGNIHQQGEGGVFTADRLAALKTGEGGLGNNPSTMNLYSDLRTKFAKMGEEVRLTLEDIEGSIYLDEAFNFGTLYHNGVAYKKLFLRYDAYNDEIEIKESSTDQEVQALVKNSSLSCALNGDVFVFKKRVDENGSEKHGYLIPLYNGGTFKLYERKTILFKEGKAAKTSHGTSFPHRFLKGTSYYISVGEEAPNYLKLKKSDIIDAFGAGHTKAVKEFMRDKKTNVNEPADLINLFAFANGLE